MPLSDEGGGPLTAEAASESLLVRTLERARAELRLSLKDWSQYLSVTEAEYDRILNGSSELSIVSLYHLSERLRINPADIETGEIDFAALASCHRGQRDYINPKYTVAANSKKHTVINALDYLAKFRGLHLRQAVNRHFQIDESFWTSQPEDAINVRFLVDLWNYLRKNGLESEDFRSLGRHSAFTLQGTPIASSIASHKTLPRICEAYFSELISRFERNCDYRVTKLTSDTCVVESVTKPEVAEALEVSQIGSIEGCRVRAGIFEALPHYVGMPSARVFETHCVHLGDTRCRFLIDLSVTRTRDNGVRLSLISN